MTDQLYWVTVKWSNKVIVQKYAPASAIRKLLYNLKGMKDVEMIVRDESIELIEPEEVVEVVKPLTVRQQRLKKKAIGNYIGSKKGKLYRKNVEV